jgi:hypothetical protein
MHRVAAAIGWGSWQRPCRAALFLILSSLAGTAAAEATGPSGHWLMLVATQNLREGDEAAFNHWYDDIDIPDVLKVPGYQRARRGVRQSVAGFSSANEERAEGRYLALYDIETSNIDRTIIDMLLAAKKMDMTGRSIDALKVTERVYWRRHGAPLEVADAEITGRNIYLYLERVACCRDEATENALDEWYDNTRLPDVAHAGAPGLLRITRYEVYRVVMVEPRTVPRFLTVYEFAADSAQQVVAAMHGIDAKLAKADRLSEWFTPSGSAVFQQIRDVRRP